VAKMSSDDIVNLARKGIMALIYVVGSMLTAFNLLAFTADKYGHYYKDENQWWFAIGVAMLLLPWLRKKWKEL